MPFVEHPLIKPNTIESRTYQEAILNTASKRNTLCVLPTGLGKCHAYSDLILLPNGEVKEIGEVVENHLKESNNKTCDGGTEIVIDNSNKFNILSLVNGKFQLANVRGFCKLKADKLVKIETESGSIVIVTPEHPLLTTDGNRLMWSPAGNFSKGSYVIVPSKIDIRGEESQEIDFLSVFKTVPGKSPWVKFKNGSVCKIREMPRHTKNSEIDGIYYKGGYGKSQEILLRPLEKVTPDLFMFFGLVLAEARVSGGIKFYNENCTLLDLFERIVRDVFGLTCSDIKGGKIVRCTSLVYLMKFLFNLQPRSHSKEKIIPSIVMKATNNEIAAFLMGYYDGEAWVSKDSIIELSTASMDIARKLPYLLLRFGIRARIKKMMKEATNSHVHKKRLYYRILIEGKDNLEKFREFIGFMHPDKANQLNETIKSVKVSNTNVDTFPVGNAIRKIRNTLKLTSTKHKDFTFLSSIDIYERNERSPSRRMLQKIVNEFENKYKEKMSLEREIEDIRSLKEILEKPTLTLKNIENMDAILKKTGVFNRQLLQWVEKKREPRIKSGYPFLRILSEKGIINFSPEEVIKKLMKELGITFWMLKREKIFMIYRRPSKLLRLLDFILNYWEKLVILKVDIERLKYLAYSDIMFDKVKNIEIINEPQYVYDLTVPDTQNFIAGNFGGVVSHNTTLAILLAAHRLEKYPETRILIMAPTRPLCAQHQKTFRECLNIPEEEIILLTGKVSPGKRYELYKQAKIISATPQCVDGNTEIFVIGEGPIKIKDFVQI